MHCKSAKFNCDMPIVHVKKINDASIGHIFSKLKGCMYSSTDVHPCVRVCHMFSNKDFLNKELIM